MMVVFVIILTLLIIYLISIYNRLVGLKNRIEQAFADIKVVLKQRADTLQQLIPVVKGYANHEKTIFEEVSKVRAQITKPDLDLNQTAELDKQLTGLIGRLFAIAEAYPELKASENFKQLQKTITELEEQIQRARRYYNAVVRDYNNLVMMFPTNIIAGLFGFRQQEYYEVEEGVEKTPKVEF